MEIKREVVMEVLKNKSIEEIANYFDISIEEATKMKSLNERNYWEISYKDLIFLMHWAEEDNWMKIRNLFGEKCFKTFSDRGGVLVGNDNFQTLIRNGRGDGITRVAVLPLTKFDDYRFWSNLMVDTEILLDGQFNIYFDDCSTNEVCRTLNGKYTVYYYDGLVLFLEIEKYE
ncbi:hypothetical protein CIRMBP1315_02279 [Enterococcus cecorum]|uniref:hypothetical protein n=1 Tax=Enterococcus cecorum TaxID=44008 RepID=UPI000642B7D6|nr:hypothetical protein [Enterococcus cecorum]KLO64330.1 hypothetical protein AA986_11380 [Enterococcus cecorum]CAI3511056.1 hypothetical protein CIRMBP1315_02279 [Enterococcus cecorum]